MGDEKRNEKGNWTKRKREWNELGKGRMLNTKGKNVWSKKGIEEVD